MNTNFKDRACFYRCTTQFAIKRHDGIAVYPCDILILEMTDSGTRYVYDFVKMQKPTLTAKSSLSSDLVHRLYDRANLTGESAISNIIPQSTAVGNVMTLQAEDVAYLEVASRVATWSQNRLYDNLQTIVINLGLVGNGVDACLPFRKAP